jgi:hypothetical protein
MLSGDDFSFGVPKDAAPKKKQKQWGSFSLAKKQNLRKTNKDTDKDGVPDLWDCQPRNPFKQDKYSEKELDKIASLGSIKVGRKLGWGGFGAVHEIVPSDSSKSDIADEFVVKISLEASRYDELARSGGGTSYEHSPSKTFERFVEREGYEFAEGDRSYKSVIDEYRDYKALGLEDMSLVLPAKPTIVELEGGKRAFAILKPRVNPVSERHMFSDKEAEGLKRIKGGNVGVIAIDTIDSETDEQVFAGMTQLSEKGLMVWDHIQGGYAERDDETKFHIFDTGAITSKDLYESRYYEDVPHVDTDKDDLMEVNPFKMNDRMYRQWKEQMDNYSGYLMADSTAPSGLVARASTFKPVHEPPEEKYKIPGAYEKIKGQQMEFADWETITNTKVDGKPRIVLGYTNASEFRMELSYSKAARTYTVYVIDEGKDDTLVKYNSYSEALWAMTRAAQFVSAKEGDVYVSEIEDVLSDSRAGRPIPTLRNAVLKYKFPKWTIEEDLPDDVVLRFKGHSTEGKEVGNKKTFYFIYTPVIELNAYAYDTGDYILKMTLYNEVTEKGSGNAGGERQIDTWIEHYFSIERIAKAVNDVARKVERMYSKPVDEDSETEKLEEIIHRNRDERQEIAMKLRREHGRTERRVPAQTPLLGQFFNMQKSRSNKLR